MDLIMGLTSKAQNKEPRIQRTWHSRGSPSSGIKNGRAPITSGSSSKRKEQNVFHRCPSTVSPQKLAWSPSSGCFGTSGKLHKQSVRTGRRSRSKDRLRS